MTTHVWSPPPSLASFACRQLTPHEKLSGVRSSVHLCRRKRGGIWGEGGQLADERNSKQGHEAMGSDAMSANKRGKRGGKEKKKRKVGELRGDRNQSREKGVSLLKGVGFVVGSEFVEGSEFCCRE